MDTLNRKRVGLALGGGVVRGMAHVGVLKVLLEANIPIDLVAGTSAGALIGAIYCAGIDPAYIDAVARKVSWRRLARPVWPVRGLVSFDPLESWLDRELNGATFQDLAKPLRIIVTDLVQACPVELCEGPVARAVHASCAVPGFVNPVTINRLTLGDGSLSDTVPVKSVRSMGAEYVIGVDIFTAAIRPKWGPPGMALTALEILVERAGGGIETADCLIEPKLQAKSYLSFRQRNELIRLGEEAARDKLPEIQKALGIT